MAQVTLLLLMKLTKRHIIDLKYGKGVSVEAEQNTQAMLYALGVIDDLGFMYEFDTVVIHIYQPRIKKLFIVADIDKISFRVAEGVTTRQRDKLPDAATHTKRKGVPMVQSKSNV